MAEINGPELNGGEALICRGCGKTLQPGSVFCGGCGTKVQSAPPAQPLSYPPPAPQYPSAAYQPPVAAYPPAPPAYQPAAYEAIPVLPRTDLKPWAVALVSGVCAFLVVGIAFLVYMEIAMRWPF